MGTTAEKLTYLGTTKQNLKTVINATGATLDNEDTFRSYANVLNNQILGAINGTIDLFEEYPKNDPVEITEGTLTDTIEARMKILSLKGDTSQITYTGKNLFSSEMELGTLDNTTGANKSSTTAVRTTNYIEVEPNIQYTMSNNLNYWYYVYEYTNDKSFISYSTRTNGNPYTFTTKATTKYIRIRTNATENQNNTDVLYQLETGSRVTSYEPYVGGQPSPSPSYPQNIQVVKGNNTINLCGKNLWGGFSLTRSSASIDYVLNVDGSVNMTGTATATTYSLGSSDIASHLITLQAGTYTLSGATSTIRLVITNSSGTNIYNTSGETSVTFTLTESTEVVVRVNVGNGVTTNTTIYPMLEKNSRATSYEPYQVQTYPITLPSGMEMCSVETYNDIIFKNESTNPLYDDSLTENGWYLMKNIGKIDSYNGETIETDYISTTGGLDIGATVYYGLSETSYIAITDSTLLSQLNDLEEKISSYQDETNITQVNADLPFNIKLSTLLDLEV